MTQNDELNWLDDMIRCWRGEIAWRRQHDHYNVPYDLARIVCQLEVRKEQIEQANNNIIQITNQTNPITIHPQERFGVM